MKEQRPNSMASGSTSEPPDAPEGQDMPVIRPEFPDHSSPFSREQERKRKETAILSAAAQRFDSDGVHGTRLEDIAADLGLTKTSIGYYFASKSDLAAAAYKHSADFLDEAITRAVGDGGSHAEQIVSLFKWFASMLLEIDAGQRPFLASINDLNALDEQARADVAARLSSCVEQVNRLVEGWMKERDHPLGRAEPATFFIFGLLDWMTGWLSRKRHFDIQEASSTLFDLVEHGLANGDWKPIQIRAGSPQMGVPQIFDREARNRMKREAFLKAGTRFFNSLGFAGVALSEVAASLGVTRGAFYYHFPDKEQLLDQCVERSLAAVEAALDRAEETAETNLSVIEHSLRDLIYQQAGGVELLLRPSLISALPAPRQRRHSARLRNIARRFGDALENAVSTGEARSVDVGIVEQIVTNAVFLNGGYTIAAANSFTDWRISEDPMTATVDYTYILMSGLGAGR